MFYLRQKQLLEDSRINLPYVPNNSRNLNQPKDFEYDIAASALYLYKIIDGCEVQFFIMWMSADKLRHFHVRASRWNHNEGVYLINSWFQDDVTGHWYMLSQDGTMYSGLVTDQSTGKSYLLNTNHDGTYGRMLTINGVYNINGKEIYLEFNQEHDGSYGGITRGLTEVKETGIKETGLASIPTDSATTTTPSNQTQTQNQNTSNNSNTSKEYKSSWEGNSDGETNGLGMDIDMSKYDPADISHGYSGDINWSAR